MQDVKIPYNVFLPFLHLEERCLPLPQLHLLEFFVLRTACGCFFITTSSSQLSCLLVSRISTNKFTIYQFRSSGGFSFMAKFVICQRNRNSGFAATFYVIEHFEYFFKIRIKKYVKSTIYFEENISSQICVIRKKRYFFLKNKLEIEK